jgi:putative sugar O-methyltransferase
MYHHEEICYDAVNNDNAFSIFKQNQKFVEILEHVTYEQGLLYITEIKKYQYKHYDWNLFLENDIIGNPLTYNYYNQLYEVKMNTYNISPSTLRYICFGLKILEYFKQNMQQNIDIVEIGGGYGGQCKILQDIFHQNNIQIKSYTLIDLDGVCKLQNRYLTTLGFTNIITLSNTECLEKIYERYDLCISNYALGEFQKNIQDFYINNVLLRSRLHFITWNTYPIHDFFMYSNFIEESPQTNPTVFKNVIITTNYAFT